MGIELWLVGYVEAVLKTWGAAWKHERLSGWCIMQRMSVVGCFAGSPVPVSAGLLGTTYT